MAFENFGSFQPLAGSMKFQYSQTVISQDS